MEHTTNGQQAEFFVVLADQGDLSQAAALHSKSEKGRYVYNTLFNKSQTTQGQSFNGYANVESSITLFMSLTQSW
jgi:hypothetical protein